MSKIGKILLLIVIFILCFCPVLTFAANSTAENSIVLFDYYLPFDVWQGSGNTSVTVKYHSNDETINTALQFDNFEYISDADGKEINTNYYTVENADDFILITFNEEYLLTLEDGVYYYNAQYKGINMPLVLYTVKEKAIVFDMVFESNTWNGTDWAEFKINGVPKTIGKNLLEFISYCGETLDDDDYDVSFFGNNGIIMISPEYLKNLSPGTHYFDVEFLSISGILLKIEIPDFYCKGDADGNGKITAADARLTLRASAQLEVLSYDAKAAADVNEDGSVTAADSRLILQYSANLISKFPADE